MSEYARVYLLDNPYSVDRAFEYFIPSELRGFVWQGDFVTVPFGTANRKKLGLVSELSDSPENPKISYKPIISVCDRSMSLSEEQLGLCFFLKEQTLCTVGDAVRAMIPASALSRLEEVYRVSDTAKGSVGASDGLDSPTLLVFEFIQKKGNARFDLLKMRFGPSAESEIKKLLSRGLIVQDLALRSTQEKSETLCSLAIELDRADRILKGEDEEISLRSANHRAIIKYFFDTQTDVIPEKALCDTTGTTSAQVSALCSKGLISRERHVVDRSIRPSVGSAEKKEITLNGE